MLGILVVIHVDAHHLAGVLALRGHEVEVGRVGAAVLARIIPRPIVARVAIAILAMATFLLALSLPLPVPAALAGGPPVVSVVARWLHAGRALLVVMRLTGQRVSPLRVRTTRVGCSATADAALLGGGGGGGTSIGATAIGVAAAAALALTIGTFVIHLGLAGGRMGHGQGGLLAARGGLMAVTGLLLGRGAVGHVLLLRLAVGIKGVIGV